MFVMYNVSISPDLNPYLSKYQNEGNLHIYSWQHPLLRQTHYYAQRVLINDCIYRYMYRSRYIVVKDLDEIIVPRGGNTSLLELLSNLPQDYIAEYNIRQVCFPDDYHNDPPVRFKAPAIHKFSMRPILHVNRSAKVFPHRNRSKYIVNPRNVYEADIHFAMIDKPYQKYDVSEDQALVHHYRKSMVQNSHSTIIDRTIYAYGKNIIYKIRDRYGELNISRGH